MTLSKAIRAFSSILVLVAVLATLAGCLSPWNWYADQFTHYRPHCLMAIIASGAVFAVCRRWRWVAIAIVGGTINLWILAPHQMPFPRVSESESPRLRVLALNLLQGNRQPKKVLDYLSDSGADVVLLQEVTREWKIALEAIESRYPFNFWHPRKDQFGLAILATRRLDAVEFRHLGNSSANLAVFARFSHDGRTVRIAGIHPDKPTRRWKTLSRSEYFEGLVDWMKGSGNEAAVVAGDFNATPWSVSFEKFIEETGLEDTSQGHVLDATWNRWRPDRLLIDHILVSRDFFLKARIVGRDVGSDHRPLVVDLQF